MPERARISLKLHFRFLTALTVILAATSAPARAADPYYGRLNTFGVFVAYSPDSSLILLGSAENRMLLDVGVSYSRRLFLNHVVNWQYNGELLPVALESDPVAELKAYQTSPTVTTITTSYGPVVDCAPQVAQYSVTFPNGVTYSGTETIFCSGRRWTVG